MKINKDFLKETIGDECVLVPVGDSYQHGVFTLNQTAQRIFDLLCEGTGRDTIVSTLCAEYDTDIDTAAAAVDEFLAELHKNGILTDD